MQRLLGRLFLAVAAFPIWQTPLASAKETWTPMIEEETESPELLRLEDGVATSTLTKGQDLKVGQGLISPDKRFKLVFQADGNFVLYYKGRPIWTARTLGLEGQIVRFQADGNLVMYKADGKTSVWNSQTNGKEAVAVRLGNDGVLGIYDNANVPVWTSGTCCFPAAEPSDTRPAAIGKWGPKMDWPIIPIHAVVMPNGKLFTFGTDQYGLQGAQLFYDIWTPTKGSFLDAHETLPNTLNTDIFCASAAVVPISGDVLITGGDGRVPPNMNKGIRDTSILKADNQTLIRGPYLANARWYPTTTTLASGEIMVHGGTDSNGTAILTPEVYSPLTNSWRSLFGAVNADIINGGESKWFYPRHFVAPDGRVFGMTADKMYYIDPRGRGAVQVVQNLPNISRSYTSTAVMYQPGKILQVGGTTSGDIGARASDGVIDVDISGEQPVVKRLNPMAFERAWANSTVLPSGDVLITGGSARENQLIEPGYPAELWNPTTQTFRPLAATTIARLYHSTAILLPDATVFVGGGGAPGPLVNTNAEIFYPPYLFDADGNFADRPTIGFASAREDYDHRSNISYGGSAPSKVVLVRAGTVTHSFNMEQRYIPLSFTMQGNTLNVRMPKDANIAPPGYYMLFIVNEQGVPSIAKIISLGVPRDRAVLLPGDALSVGDSLQSAKGRVRLTLQSDSNLVLSVAGQTVWSTMTKGRDVVKAVLGEDGNFALYNADDTVIWSSETSGTVGGRLTLRDDGTLVLSDEFGWDQWSSAKR